MAKTLVRTTKSVWDNKTDKSEYNNSIVFIEDAELIWSNEVYYNCSNSRGGYPVITATDNFNIEAEPNTFYNIKNSGEDSVNINIKDEDLYIEDMNKLILFTFDNDTSGSNTWLLFKLHAHSVGWRFIPDLSLSGYNYKITCDLTSFGFQGILEVWSKQYPTSGINLDIFINCPTMGIENIEMTLINITVFNETEDYLGGNEFLTSAGNFCICPVIFKDEIDSDKDEYLYCYNCIYLTSPEKLYTNTPYPQCNSYYIPNTGFSDIPLQLNKNIKGSGVANEFIFNINSPANVTFNQNIKWDIEPDFTKKGTYTISIIDGKGSYKFIK